MVFAGDERTGPIGESAILSALGAFLAQLVIDELDLLLFFRREFLRGDCLTSAKAFPGAAFVRRLVIRISHMI
jgi:hypothetical protein